MKSKTKLEVSQIEGKITKGIFKDKHLEIIFGETLRQIKIKINGEEITNCSYMEIKMNPESKFPKIKLNLISIREKQNVKEKGN